MNRETSGSFQEPSELKSTEFFQIEPGYPQFIGTYNAEILNLRREGPTIYLNLNATNSTGEPSRSLTQSQRGDVVVQNISRAGYNEIQKIFDANAEKGMQGIKRALSAADFLTQQRPFINRNV